jgi:hypothetical protein
MVETLQAVCQSAYAVAEEAKSSRRQGRMARAAEINNNGVFVLRQLQEGTKTKDYWWLTRMLRGQVLELLLNPSKERFDQLNA